MLLYKLKHK